MSDPKIKANIDYLKILAQKLQTVPAWRDFARACNDVIGREVDDKRKLLTKMRDSVKYRRGDVLTNFTYSPEGDRVAVNEATRETVDIPFGMLFPKADIKNVIHNIAYFGQPDSTDYLDLSFNYKGVVCRWLMPVDAVQEREILLNNSYIMGFDFFNTKLSDEDLKRLYEYIQIYWNESGSDDNFMKFIGFIKNTRFDLVPLWTETPNGEMPTDPDAEYPYLEPKNENMVSVADGGNHWLTSHAEIQFDLAQFEKFYVVNLEDLEQLFYYFAPINVVLERVTGRLDVETPVKIASCVALADFELNKWEPATKFTTIIKAASVSQLTIHDASVYNIPYELETKIGVATIGSVTTYDLATLNTNDDSYFGLDQPVNFNNKVVNFRPYIYSATGA